MSANEYEGEAELTISTQINHLYCKDLPGSCGVVSGLKERVNMNSDGKLKNIFLCSNISLDLNIAPEKILGHNLYGFDIFRKVFAKIYARCYGNAMAYFYVSGCVCWSRGASTSFIEREIV